MYTWLPVGSGNSTVPSRSSTAAGKERAAAATSWPRTRRYRVSGGKFLGSGRRARRASCGQRDVGAMSTRIGGLLAWIIHEVERSKEQHGLSGSDRHRRPSPYGMAGE